jgi:hypothetical protein
MRYYVVRAEMADAWGESCNRLRDCNSVVPSWRDEKSLTLSWIRVVGVVRCDSGIDPHEVFFVAFSDVRADGGE